jgi:hypothetical protein
LNLTRFCKEKTNIFVFGQGKPVGAKWKSRFIGEPEGINSSGKHEKQERIEICR